MAAHTLAPRTWIALGFLIAVLWILCPATGWSQVNVFTQHNDTSRTGQNLNETILTTSNVNVNTFGKLFSVPVDGYIYAQPLYVSGLTIAGGIQNVVYIATAHNSVFACDADSGTIYWQVNLGPSVPSSDIKTPNMPIEIGITSTPVIDPLTNTIYVCTDTKDSGAYHFRLHALDLTSGAEKFGGPTLIQASVPGNGYDSVRGVISFNPFKENNRPGLLLLNGVVYLAFGSHEDYDPYHGWVIAYNASTLQQIAAWSDTPNGQEGGIWQSGQGPTADVSGNVYLMMGNGTTSSPVGGSDYGEAFVKLSLTGSALSVADWFTPNDYDYLNANDEDLGSSGVLGIPGTSLLLGGGKEGKLYLLNSNGMGHYNAGTDAVLQEFQAVQTGHDIHGAPVYWNSPSGPRIYLWGDNDVLRAFQFIPANGPTPASIKTTPVLVGSDHSPGEAGVTGSPGGFLSISANGSQPGTGIVWATTPWDGNADQATYHGILRAYDATNLAKELWDSKKIPARDDFGYFAKFSCPTVANGKVYLPTFSNQLCVYGLLPAPVVMSTVQAAPGDTSVSLTWTAVPYATSYNIYRGLTPSGESLIPVATGVINQAYIDPGLTNGATYYYTVAAVNGSGLSAKSNEVQATPRAMLGSTISLDFLGGGSTGYPLSMAATEVAGVVPVANWNGGVGAAGSLVGLYDNLGGATGATASWSSGGTWSVPIVETPGNARMMKGYLDTPPGSKPTTVTVSNLPPGIAAGVYSVYVYLDGDNRLGNRTGMYTIGNSTISATDAASTSFNGTFTQGSNSAGNYVKFNGVTGIGFTLIATPGASSDAAPRAPINGIQIVGLPPVTPTNLQAAVSGTSVSLTWTASSTATSYNVYRGIMPGGEGAAPVATGVPIASYTDLGLVNSTTYYYTVVAVNANGQSPASNEASAPIAGLPPMAPINLQASVTGTSVALTWTVSATATSYNVYRGTTPGSEGPTPVATGITANSYADTGLTNGTTYFYTVVAVNANGSSASSNEAQASIAGLPPTAPANLQATVSGTTVGLNWTASATAASYSVYRGTTSGGEAVTPIATGITVSSYTDLGLVNGTTYCYTVVAVNANGQSPASNEASAPIAGLPPVAPTGLQGTVSGTSVGLTWAASATATSYNVYRGTMPGGEGATPIATGITIPSYLDSGLSNGTTYYYTVVAVNGNGSSGLSNEASAVIAGLPPMAAASLQATVTGTSVSLTWTASSTATSYNVYRGTTSGGEAATPIAMGITAPSYSDLGLMNGTTYYYTVIAVNANGQSSASNEASAPIAGLPPVAPTGLQVTVSGTSVGLTWAASPTATSYNVYRGTTPGGEGIIPIAMGVTLTSYSDIGMTNGITYFYTVVAVNGNGSSGFSNEASAAIAGLPPAAPANLQASVTGTGAGLTWTASATATSYNIYRGVTPGGEGTSPIASGITVTAYTDAGLTSGTTYYYTVVAVNLNGPSGNSNEAQAVIKPAGGSIISLSFVGGRSNLTITPLAATETAGAVAATNWNNGFGANGAIGSLLDNLGNQTTASTSWSSGGVWSLPITQASSNARMMAGYLDTPPSNKQTTVTVSNLPASVASAGYSVYVYIDGDNRTASRTGIYTIGTTTITATDAANTNFSGAFTQGNNGVGNYIVFSGLTASGFTLKAVPGASTDSGVRAPINAIQIVANTTGTVKPKS